MTTAVPLRRLLDDEEWEAEDLAGRLGTVAHAAFLRSGFVPYGDEPSSGHLLKQVDEVGPSAPSLSRRYTLPQLARRSRCDVAVQELRGGTNGDVAFFRAYLLTTDGHRRRLCEAVLDAAVLAPLISGRLDDAARALETGGGGGAWLWKSLVDWVLPVLHLELCRRNDLPVTGFASLPDDAKMEVLKRLTDWKDLARVECTSRQLRRLVAERDGELWKPMYESMKLLPPEAAEGSGDDSEGLAGSWKERYVNALRQPQRRSRWAARLFDSFEELFSRHLREEHEAGLQERLREFEFSSLWEDSFFVEPVEFGVYDYPPYMVHNYPPAPPPEPEPVARRKHDDAGSHRRKVPRHEFRKKRHGAGAIHSPSSRYKWNHR